MGAVIAACVLAATLTACSSGDKAGCNVMNDALQDVYTMADDWGDGLASRKEMVDELADLRDTASGQVAAADGTSFKQAALDVQGSASKMYTAVRNDAGQEAAANSLVAAGRRLQAVCAEIKSA